MMRMVCRYVIDGGVNGVEGVGWGCGEWEGWSGFYDGEVPTAGREAQRDFSGMSERGGEVGREKLYGMVLGVGREKKVDDWG